MSTIGARSQAVAVKNVADTNGKLDRLADAIYQLANAIDEIEREIKRAALRSR